MRRLIVVATLVLATTGTAGADSGRCAAEQQAVRADRAAIGVDGHALRAVRASEAAVRAERQPLHYLSRRIETRIAHNENEIIRYQNWESCEPASSMHCKNESAHYFKAVGALARNTAQLELVAAQIAVFDAQLAALADQEAQALERLAVDHAQLAQDRTALEACQAS